VLAPEGFGKSLHKEKPEPRGIAGSSLFLSDMRFPDPSRSLLTTPLLYRAPDFLVETFLLAFHNSETVFILNSKYS